MEPEPSAAVRMPHESDAVTDPALIRSVLAGIRPAAAIAAPPGMIPFARRDVIAAGLDPRAVSRWLEAQGGYGGAVYLRPAAHKLSTSTGACRPALQPVSYFAVPAAALALPTRPAGSAA